MSPSRQTINPTWNCWRFGVVSLPGLMPKILDGEISRKDFKVKRCSWSHPEHYFSYRRNKWLIYTCALDTTGHDLLVFFVVIKQYKRSRLWLWIYCLLYNCNFYLDVKSLKGAKWSSMSLRLLITYYSGGFKVVLSFPISPDRSPLSALRPGPAGWELWRSWTRPWPGCCWSGRLHWRQSGPLCSGGWVRLAALRLDGKTKQNTGWLIITVFIRLATTAPRDWCIVSDIITADDCLNDGFGSTG